MKFENISKLFLTGFLLLAIAACKEKFPVEPHEFDYENGLLIINEGNFQSGNGSLSFLGFTNDSIQLNVFQNINGRPLGDVVQSAVRVGNRVWIVVNNSGKIEAVDLPEMKSSCQITGLISPRYILPLQNEKALVSDLYANAISVIDLENCNKLGEIQVSAWTEEMLQIGNDVFVAQTGTDQVLVIDANSLAITDSIQVGREPNSLVADKNGKLWVLCSGGLNEAMPQLDRIDPQMKQVEARLFFDDIQSSPSELELNPGGDALYYLDGGLFKLAISDSLLPTNPFVGNGSQSFYGLGIDPISGAIYLSDAKDFQRRGTIHRYFENNLSASFEVGIIPGSFLRLN